MIAERPDIVNATTERVHLIPCTDAACISRSPRRIGHLHPCTWPRNVCRHPDCEHNTGDRPQRIQLRRTKGWRKPPSITVARPSRWGNPYRLGMIVADPVNAINPIASTHEPVAPPARASLPQTFERTAFDGTPWTQSVYVIGSAAVAVDLYRRWLIFEGFDVSSLRGHDLACWCPSGQPCHADVLLELANAQETPA